MTNKCRYFLESNFVRVNRLFVLVYLNQENDSKRFKAKKHYAPKGKFIIITSSLMEKTFMIKQLI